VSADTAGGEHTGDCRHRIRVNAQVVSSLAGSFPERFRAALIYGPFTVAGQVVGEETLMRETASRPQEAEKILEQSFECARSYADLLIEAGANLVWVSDPLAALIAPEDFQKFAGSYLRRLVLQTNGYDVLDLGVNVSAQEVFCRIIRNKRQEIELHLSQAHILVPEKIVTALKGEFFPE